jgi:hypothetical protein
MDFCCWMSSTSGPRDHIVGYIFQYHGLSCTHLLAA